MAKEKLVFRELYESVREFPIISPHSHVDPALFARENASFGDPTELFIIPDHYLHRMLYSQGISPERLGVHRIDGGEVETDHRKIWQTVAEQFYLFRGTPTGVWLADLVSRHIIDISDAREMIVDLAYGLAQKTYKLPQN